MATDEENEVFEITDFTTASDWERFTASIEEVIHEWKLGRVRPESTLDKGNVSNAKWKEISEIILFSGFRFVITHHYLHISGGDGDDVSDLVEEDTAPQALKDMMNNDIDFATSSESLSYWYGLREYVVICPALGENAIANESRAKLLLSSVCVALFNTGCQVPTFIQLHQKVEKFYLGVLEGKGIRTHFQMANLKRVHQQYSHLSGLLDVFKSKLACQISLSSNISISVCFTYNLQMCDFNGPWPQQPPDVINYATSIGELELGKIPFGTWVDPISDIDLSAIWPNLTEDVVVDNLIHSDLEPTYAPIWRSTVKYAVNIPCLLGNHLLGFLSLIDSNDTSEKLLGFRIGESSYERNIPIAQALDRLTNTVPPIINVSPVLNRTRQHPQNPECPIPEDKLKEILFFLFPDAVGKSCESTSNVKEESEDSRYKKVEESIKSLKSVPLHSLPYFLAVCLCHVNYKHDGTSAVVHLWHEFALEMRHRWENNLIIPGVEPGMPDNSTCLLSQKLQMLNYCIEKKKGRDQLQQSRSQSKDDDTTSDEEFYDCDEDRQKSSFTDKSAKFLDSYSQQPEGRLRPCGNLKLLGSDHILYIPVTQDPPPMTEDQLEAHADVLLKLGTDEEGSQLRAKMQSACLLSDMQSFKAANPNCELEDFVRWYSPRDWIVDESKSESELHKGHLSDRMLVPGNVWQSVWASAKPIPARRQRRLFDDTKEGEKVLHYLSSMTPADLASELMPVLIHAAVQTVIENDDQSQPLVPSALYSIATAAAKLPRLSSENAHQYNEVVDRLKSVETMLSQSKAFQNLFKRASERANIEYNEITPFTKELFENQEAYLHGGVKTKPGKVLLELLKDSLKAQSDSQSGDNSTTPKLAFPKPKSKEYILRTIVSRPAPYSSPTAQRMYCSQSENGFRLAGAFTQDTTFQ